MTSHYHLSRETQTLKCADSRDAGAGGGSGGATCPHNLEAAGAPLPQLWTVNVIHFYFCLFLHVNLGLSQKTVDQIREVFSFG